jgi:hypothetical protein
LWSRTSFKLIFDEQAPLIGVIFMARNFHNRTNIIAKHDTIFLGEEVLEFFTAPTVKTHLSALAQKNPALEP